MKRLLIIILSGISILGTCFAKDLPHSKDSVERVVFARGNDINELNGLLEMFRSAGDSSAVAMTFYALGRKYNQKSEYIESIEAYKRAAELQNELNETYDAIQTLVGLATSCRRIGAYSSASEYLFYALSELENSDYVDTEEGKRQHSYILNGIGNVYKYLDNGEEAEKYFRKSLAYDIQIGNYIGMAMNWTTIGSIYEYRDQFDSAAVMYNKALEYNMHVKSNNGIGICHNRLGQLAYTIGDIDKAEQAFLSGYEVLKKSNDTWNLTKSCTSLAMVYIDKGELKKAKSYLDEASELVIGRRSYGHKNAIHGYLALLYEKQGNYKKAYEEASISMAYADSMSTQKDEQAIAQSRIKFEQEQNQIAMNKVLMEKNKEVIQKKTTIIASVLIGLVLIAILLLMYRYGRLQEKHNMELMESNAIKNKFFSIISHDLKNPVIAQKNTLRLLVSNYENLPKDLVLEQCKELSKSSESLLELLISLLNWSRIEVGKMKYEPIRLDLGDVVAEAVKPLNEQMHQKNLSTEINIPSETYAYADVNATKTVIRNLVSNAIKFSHTGGVIEISASQEKSYYKVSVKDYGVGMDEERKEKIFSLSGQKSALGTAGESGSGLGLIVCKELVEMTGGHINIESAPNKGTTISFTIKTASA